MTGTEELMRGFLIFGVILLLLALLAVKLHFDRRKQEAQMRRKIQKAYGEIPAREYRPQDLDSIGYYFRNYGQHGKTQIIDDITWNDLDMDRIFMAVNATWSSSGEEYLYKMLRTPCTEEVPLAERERLIRYFAEHEKERTELSLALCKIGKMKGLSTWEFVGRLLELPQQSTLPDVLQAVAGVASIALLVTIPTVGIICFIAVMCLNIGTYYKKMGQDRPYITCFRYVMRLLEQAKLLEKVDIPELRGYLERMRQARMGFQKFQKNSFLLKEGQSVAGDLMESLMDYFRMFFHLDIIKFHSMLEELKKHVGDARTLMETAGLLDACIAVASFRELMPYTAEPVFVTERLYHAEQLYHPLIEYPVPNDIRATGGVLITGSNASGKSTFLKTAAINAILAQTLHTVLAKSYEGSFFCIYSSMALRDDLSNQESYYIAEIRSLKRILDQVGRDCPTLCFVDEVLRGTNTVERIAASSQVLKSLSSGNVICFAATHDIELTYILERIYENYHFSEDIREEQISFSYKLYAGRAMTRNAIRLLGLIGYDPQIVEEAERYAQRFLETGVWENF